MYWLTKFFYDFCAGPLFSVCYEKIEMVFHHHVGCIDTVL